jgi:hypothetical protein
MTVRSGHRVYVTGAVDDLEAAVHEYTGALNAPPIKQEARTATFEPSKPALTLQLVEAPDELPWLIHARHPRGALP